MSPRPSIALLLATGLVLGGGAATTAPRAEPLGTRALCSRYPGMPAAFERDEHAGMVWIEGGDFVPGSDHGYPEERGGTRVHVDGFFIDRTEVTNAQFERFVKSTGYVTQAERDGSAPVFHSLTAAELEQRGEYAWWTLTPGASFRRPEGPGSDSAARPNHPVVQISYDDALAYARWLGRSLPSELQWEYAAKAGRDSIALHREPRDAHGRPLANFWQGEFPVHNTNEDGFVNSAPVGCFAPNPFGVFDMLGNVWEWTRSPYTSSHRAEDADERDAASANGVGCIAGASAQATLVIKGGSYLCAANFCARYRVAARHAQAASQPAMHIGFRTVLEPRR